jgi:hypothetical protein
MGSDLLRLLDHEHRFHSGGHHVLAGFRSLQKNQLTGQLSTAMS